MLCQRVRALHRVPMVAARGEQDAFGLHGRCAGLQPAAPRCDALSPESSERRR